MPRDLRRLFFNMNWTIWTENYFWTGSRRVCRAMYDRWMRAILRESVVVGLVALGVAGCGAFKKPKSPAEQASAALAMDGKDGAWVGHVDGNLAPVSVRREPARRDRCTRRMDRARDRHTRRSASRGQVSSWTALAAVMMPRLTDMPAVRVSTLRY